MLDAILLGASPDTMVAAARLAAGGWKVQVLESGPGARGAGPMDWGTPLRPHLLAEFPELRAAGHRPFDPVTSLIQGGEIPIRLTREVDRTCGLLPSSVARSYRDYAGLMERSLRFADSLLDQIPTPLHSTRLLEVLDLANAAAQILSELGEARYRLRQAGRAASTPVGATLVAGAGLALVGAGLAAGAAARALRKKPKEQGES